MLSWVQSLVLKGRSCQNGIGTGREASKEEKPQPQFVLRLRCCLYVTVPDPSPGKQDIAIGFPWQYVLFITPCFALIPTVTTNLGFQFDQIWNELKHKPLVSHSCERFFFLDLII